MRHNRSIASSLGPAALLVVCACTDLLKEDPKGFTTTDTFYKTGADLNSATIAIYNALRGLQGQAQWTTLELASDQARADTREPNLGTSGPDFLIWDANAGRAGRSGDHQGLDRGRGGAPHDLAVQRRVREPDPGTRHEGGGADGAGRPVPVALQLHVEERMAAGLRLGGQRDPVGRLGAERRLPQHVPAEEQGQQGDDIRHYQLGCDYQHAEPVSAVLLPARLGARSGARRWVGAHPPHELVLQQLPAG